MKSEKQKENTDLHTHNCTMHGAIVHGPYNGCIGMHTNVYCTLMELQAPWYTIHVAYNVP